MSIERRMREKLIAALSPQLLEIVNESSLHAGHHGSPGTGESHFRVLIVSEIFKGKSRIERHRMVNDVLATELQNGVHALAIKAQSPDESGSR